MQDNRTVIRIAGPDAGHFLQGLVTVDVLREPEKLKYGALLTAQGKYLADFFIAPEDGGRLVDVHKDLAGSLMQRGDSLRIPWGEETVRRERQDSNL